jgi:hypothetical protein
MAIESSFMGINSMKNLRANYCVILSPNMVEKTDAQTLWASFTPRTLYAVTLKTAKE